MSWRWTPSGLTRTRVRSVDGMSPTAGLVGVWSGRAASAGARCRGRGVGQPASSARARSSRRASPRTTSARLGHRWSQSTRCRARGPGRAAGRREQERRPSAIAPSAARRLSIAADRRRGRRRAPRRRPTGRAPSGPPPPRRIPATGRPRPPPRRRRAPRPPAREQRRGEGAARPAGRRPDRRPRHPGEQGRASARRPHRPGRRAAAPRPDGRGRRPRRAMIIATGRRCRIQGGGAAAPAPARSPVRQRASARSTRAASSSAPRPASVSNSARARGSDPPQVEPGQDEVGVGRSTGRAHRVMPAAQRALEAAQVAGRRHRRQAQPLVPEQPSASRGWTPRRPHRPRPAPRRVEDAIVERLLPADPGRDVARVVHPQLHPAGEIALRLLELSLRHELVAQTDELGEDRLQRRSARQDRPRPRSRAPLRRRSRRARTTRRRRARAPRARSGTAGCSSRRRARR